MGLALPRVCRSKDEALPAAHRNDEATSRVVSSAYQCYTHVPSARSTSVQCTAMRLAENPHVTAIRLHLCAHCHAHPAPGKSSRTPPLTPTMMEPCRSSDFCPFGAAFIFMAHRLAVLAGRARGRPRVAMRTSLAPTGCVGPGNCATAL